MRGLTVRFRQPRRGVETPSLEDFKQGKVPSGKSNDRLVNSETEG